MIFIAFCFLIITLVEAVMIWILADTIRGLDRAENLLKTQQGIRMNNTDTAKQEEN
ncbi:hypothetical protein [Stenoxybacter acetivorans]|uniref:hypothetical protein n=1 Tax=Stenoxybacter acetivorans TaxID=422441 RepID=UPI0012EC5621|nr:hypothetical protein [Stenoxybacter acetivorans]